MAGRPQRNMEFFPTALSSFRRKPESRETAWIKAFAHILLAGARRMLALAGGNLQGFCLPFAVLPMLMLPLFSVSTAWPAEPQTAAPSDCPPREEILTDLARLSRSLLFTKLELEQLLSGKESVEMSPDSLLLVNLGDDEAVKQRRAELTEAVKLPQTLGAPKLDPVLECALSSEEFRDPARRLIEARHAIDALRLEFLELPLGKRNALLEFQRKAGQESGVLKNLRNARTKALQKKVETTISLKVAEHEALYGATVELRDMAGARAVLEKTKLNIIDKQLEKISRVQERAEFYLNTATRLGEIEAQSLRDAKLETLRQDTRDAVEIWRNIVDRTHKGSFKSLYYYELPELPELPKSISEKMGNTEEARQYLASLDEAKKEKEFMLIKAQDILVKESDSASKLLLQAGRVRSRLIEEMLRRGDSSPTQISREYFQDCLRELKMVPSQWLALLYVKSQDVKLNLGRGFAGIVELAKEVLLLLLFLSVPALIWLSLRRFITSLQKARTQLIASRDAFPMAEVLALGIQRSMPYLPWLVVILAVGMAKGLITQTVFSELAIVLPYIQIYCVCRIFHLLFGNVLAAIATQAGTAASEGAQSRLAVTAKVAGRFVLLSWSFLYAVESIVSRALIYRLAGKVVAVAGVLVAAWVANKWKEELAAVIDESAPRAISGRFAGGCRGRASLFWSLPAFVLVLLILAHQWLQKWGERFDVYKRLSARVFRRKLEMSAAGTSDDLGKELPGGYAKWFAQCDPLELSVQVVPQNDLLVELKGTIEEWRKGAIDEQTLFVYGDRGSGKSTLLSRLEREFPQLRVLKSAVPSKLLSPQELFPFLGNLLGIPLHNAASLLDADRTLPKTLVLLDDAHNLFLAKVGGFQALKTFIDLVNERTNNLFWCLTFNHYSWNYLYRVFGGHRSVGMVKLPGWSESDVRELILTRHGKTGFALSYDSILKAVGGEAKLGHIAQIESNCFRLLWQQSGGVPRLALHLWLSSLRPAGPGLLRVGLPEDPDKSILALLSENALFVYTEVIRHGSLSTEEVVQTANLPDAIVRQAMKEGVDNRILVQSENGRFEISTAYQRPLINTLMVKNFIYGT